MELVPALQRGRLVRRYKRFLADVLTERGEVVTMHCPNTGAMTGCAAPGSTVWYSCSNSATRKYPCTLELVETAAADLVCINTGRANALVAEALESGRIAEAAGTSIKREVRIPGEAGRFDFVVQAADGSLTYVEVKSVTLARSPGVGEFPDAPSERATRHVRALEKLRRQGHGALLIYCVQHSAVRRVTTADDIDPAYGAAVRAARDAGVDVAAYAVRLSPQHMSLHDPVPVM
jgi:sugar fermentation stimulation protein A